MVRQGFTGGSCVKRGAGGKKSVKSPLCTHASLNFDFSVVQNLNLTLCAKGLWSDVELHRPYTDR